MSTSTLSDQRHQTVAVKIGPVIVGGSQPIVVQSMTNTDTTDIDATVTQIVQLAQAGSELVRITVNSEEAAAAVAPIREKLDAQNVSVPLIGDFHFNGHKLLSRFPDCARALAKYRINPGNVGRGKKRDEQFSAMKPTAFFINLGRGGTVDEEALVRALESGSIAGAGLDVFQSEPLPRDHPLWDLKNVIITPHVGGKSDIYSDQVLPILEENLHRYLKGERRELVNFVER